MKYLLIILIFSSNALFATGANDQIEYDPCARINYRRAFDLSDIQKKYAPLMRELGCAENVFKDDPDLSIAKRFRRKRNGYIQLEENGLNDDMMSPDRTAYDKACLARLNKERRAIITRPGKEAFLMMCSMVGVAGLISQCAGASSVGGSVGIFTAATSSVYYIRDIIRALYNLKYTPPQPIDACEIAYLKHQCFIPRNLWPILLTKFLLARNNPFQQQQALDFINFTVGLTTFKKTKEDSRLTLNLKQARQELATKIDLFFKDYENVDPFELEKIKTNAIDFLAVLCGEHRNLRPLYFVGPGGIGKTHFAHELKKWIEEIYPETVHLEEPEILDPEELLGSETEAGVFLKALRNQCQAQKKSTLLFIDEADWLNRDVFMGSAKRTFNGDQSVLQTTYLGRGPNGDGVTIDLPPMLVILAGNHTIQDEALHSRFDSFVFPKPTSKALFQCALRQASDHPYAKMIGMFIEGDQVSQRWRAKIKLTIKGCQNFRDIQSLIPRLMNKWERENLP